MAHPIFIPGFEGQTLSVDYTGWNGTAWLYINGQPAARCDASTGFLLTRADGRQVCASVRYTRFGLIPVVQIEGHTFRLPSPLRWFHWPFIVLPLILVAVGGMLGGLFGAIGFVVNVRILSGDRPDWLKAAAALAVAALVTGLFYTAASIVSSLLS